MPTANTASPRSAKAGVKSAAARTSKPKAKRAKVARARAVKPTRVAARQTTTSTSRLPITDPVGAIGDYAERAVLIPVGVALTARDRVLASVSDTISNYSSTSKAQAQLRRFERRGATARKRLEREVRKTRVRVERDLRQRRREIEKTVSDFEDRRDVVAKNGTEFATRVPELANRVQERILSLV